MTFIIVFCAYYLCRVGYIFWSVGLFITGLQINYWLKFSCNLEGYGMGHERAHEILKNLTQNHWADTCIIFHFR